MSSLADYKELIRSIKTIGVRGISPNDKQVLLDLLSTLKYICEFRILRQCYDQDEAINSIIPDIDAKLAKLKQSIDTLEGKLLDQGSLSEFERIKLKATTVTYNRYVEIKKAITTRNFDHYVEFMNKNVSNATQITAICSSVLQSADVDYAKTFEINGNEKTALDIIYDLKKQPELTKELTRYFNRKKHYTVDNEMKIREDQQFLNYLKVIKDNEVLVRNFMDALFTVGTAENDKEVVVRERLSKDRLQLANLSKTVLSSLKNSREISSLSHSIDKDERELAKIVKVKESFGQLLEEMNKVGLTPIADQFVASAANLDDSVEQRVVNYLKAAMKKNSFDIREVEHKIEEEVRFLESQIFRKEELLEGSYEKLSVYGKELASKYEAESEKILDVVNNNIKGDVTPIFAAYALKALIDAKSLNFKALNDVMHAYDNEGIEALVSSYEAIVRNTVANVQQVMNDVTNRAIYDTKEFGQLKIR